MESIAHQPAWIAAIVLAVAAAVTDAVSRRVPNALSAAGVAAGLALNTWSHGGAGLLRSLLGLTVGFCVFLPFFALRGMGGGDVKLMAALGACLGAIGVLQAAVVASLAGALLALGVAARHGAVLRTLGGTLRLMGSWMKRGPRPSKELSLDNPATLKIPYALPIAAGALFIVLSAS